LKVISLSGKFSFLLENRSLLLIESNIAFRKVQFSPKEPITFIS
jgi:hypothetical protein